MTIRRESEEFSCQVIPSKRRAAWLALSIALLTAIPAAAQSEWRSALYPATWTPPANLQFESDTLIQDFSYAGYRRGEVEIPRVAGPIHDVTAYGADSSGNADSTAAIQEAIDAAAAGGGGVVYLPEGMYRISPQRGNNHALRVASSNIVLRGAGRGRTFIFNDSFAMRSRHIIRVDNNGPGWSTVPAGSPQSRIARDLLSPTTAIPVSSVSGFAPGDWVVLRADATNEFIAEHNMTDLWGGLGANLGGVIFLRQVTAIDEASQTLTVDVPIRYYLKTRDNARVHKAVPHVEEVGLEDFSIGNREHANAASSRGWGEEDYNVGTNPSYDVHASYAIVLQRARNCWISNVASYRPAVNTLNTHVLSNGILLANCRGVTARHCDFQRPLYGGGGGNGYMYRLQASNECLVLDSAARHNRHGFVFSHMACSGNVIHGGIAQVTRVQVAGSGTTSGEGCDHHMHLSQSNLIDGVQLDRDFFTAHYRGTSGTPPQHGQTAVHSVYWNLVGLAYHSTKNFIVRSEQARYGYMIGTRGPAGGMTAPGTSTGRTAPVDHAEGAGRGATLQPLSLYHDQRTRRLGRTLPPPSPTGLAARENVTTAVLTWNASASATAYTVRRATVSGGPYTVVATTEATTHTETGLATGTAYYYVVSAANAAGSSGNSEALRVTPMPVFQQTAGADRIVSLEAENCDAQVPQGGHAWTPNRTAGHSGEGAMEATPNSGTTRDAGFVSSSPRLDFRIEFVTTGAHRVWVRGLAPGGGDDSVHVGLNGVAVASSDRISGFGTNWTWRNTTMDGPGATLDIPSAGIHTLNLWMREDGVIVDKIVLTVSGTYGPEGNGPAESPRLGSISLPAAPTGDTRIVNLASRALVGGTAGTPIAGFAVAGTGMKRLLVRAVGPGLARLGVDGTLADPAIALVADGTTLLRNDTWNPLDAGVFAAVGAFALPDGSRDAAFVIPLGAGRYTTVIDAGAGGGIALLEVYDAEPSSPAARLVNASTRAHVGAGDAILIPGFVIAGSDRVRLLLRAVGPSLAGFGVEDVLVNPELVLFRGAAALERNDDWNEADNAAHVEAAADRVGAFRLPKGSRDAAMLISLAAGNYTASVSGARATTGTALVELYVVP